MLPSVRPTGRPLGQCRGRCPGPHGRKIDTEGFKLGVFLSIIDLLRKPEVRAILFKVHFGLLNERGQPTMPADKERLLKLPGFAARWVDPSHIAAELS